MGINKYPRGFDGLPVGLIRSDRTSMKVPHETWCHVFGHRIYRYGDGAACRECGKSLDEILEKNEEVNNPEVLYDVQR